MPTGYTAGILDGTIKDFKSFALLCMRAFGATIHMRDESLEMEYTPRTPSDYHKKEIERAKKELADAKLLSDAGIVLLKEKEVAERKEYLSNRIKEVEKNWEELSNMLEEARNYNPPTENHKGVKDFMIDQLTQTLKHDGSTKYYLEQLDELAGSSFDPKTIRNELITKAKKDLAYHEKNLAEDIIRCNDSNKWVEDFMNSITPSLLTPKK